MISEEQEQILREFIDFVNLQVGVYMDAVAGFQGHSARTERQLHRIARAQRVTTDEAGRGTVVWASYEDPSQPDVIHNRIIRAADYVAANAENGTNYQQHSRAILVFLFTYWEDEVRPRLATACSVPASDIRSDIMGDLRLLRNVILHAKGFLSADKQRSLKLLSSIFRSDATLTISYEDMHKIFVLVKQDIASRIIPQQPRPPVSANDINDIAIQRV